jgi:threonine dehydratase
MTAPSATNFSVTAEDVIAAADRIKELSRRTPVVSSRWFNEAAGLQTFFKCENLQRGGAFKIRGAANFIAQLNEEERRRGVVTFSSGNHAQAVAIAAAHAGVKATIVMPTDAPKAKLDSTRAYNPEIIFFDRKTEDREALAARVARDTGGVVLPSYDHPWIVAGQGTAALELLEEQPDLDAIVVPLGGGGLLSGTLLAARQLRPEIAVFGAEPELANDWYQSLAKGERVGISPPATIADGLRTPIPGELTFNIVRALADGVLLISEDEMKETMRFLLSRLKLVVEPSGSVAAAAALFGKLPSGLKRVGVILSGGNVDFSMLAAVCGEVA